MKRIDVHISSKDILPDEQFGFLQGHSANHQLMRVSKSFGNSLRNKRSTSMLKFNVEKAFGSVWDKGLLYKMVELKFPMYLTKLIQSFLMKRSFCVPINGNLSRKRNVIAGVPQVSALSPTLYISSCEKGVFADDASVLKSAKNTKKILKGLNSASKRLADYCGKWKMKLNDDKTQAAFFTRRRASK